MLEPSLGVRASAPTFVPVFVYSKRIEHPEIVMKRCAPPTVTPLLWLYPHSVVMSFGGTFTSKYGVPSTRTALPRALAYVW